MVGRDEVRAEAEMLGVGLSEYPAELLRKSRCIYFLFLAGRLNYIGTTTFLAARLVTHCRRKEFDQVWHFPVAEEDAYALEAALIRKFRPPLNSVAERDDKGRLVGEDPEHEFLFSRNPDPGTIDPAKIPALWEARDQMQAAILAYEERRDARRRDERRRAVRRG